MKMGTVASPWRYDLPMNSTLQPPTFAQPAVGATMSFAHLDDIRDDDHPAS
jgi:hypothetical protein